MVRSIVQTLLVLLASEGASGQLQTSLNDEVRARLSEDERCERSLEASADGAIVVVEGPGGASRGGRP